MLDHVLQRDVDLSLRLQDSCTQARTSRYCSSTMENEPDAADDESVLTVRRLDASSHTISTLQEIPARGLDPDIEHGLYNSRVYLRAEGRHSLSSLPTMSGTGPIRGWSFFSYLSLGQISNVSVLSLPISSCELWIPEQYTLLTGADIQNNLDRHLKRPDRPPSTSTLAYNTILDQTLMNSKTFIDFSQTHGMSTNANAGVSHGS